MNNQNENIKPPFKILNNSIDVEIFDPPMCCPTGICGPTIDQVLLDANEMIKELKDRGYQVERYQMTSHPAKFIGNAEVMSIIKEKQLQALPIIFFRGKIIAEGAYPSFNEIQTLLTQDN